MANDKLPTGVYTCIFEIFSSSNVSPNILTDDTLIFNVYGNSYYKIITFSHDKIDNQYTKAYFQFTSDGQPGEITFQFRYYGNRFNKGLAFSFYSRVIKGKQDSHFNHNISDVANTDDNREILYFENINLNDNKMNSFSDPTDNKDAANKEYVDTENAKQDIVIADNASKQYVDNEIAKIPQQPQNVLILDGSKAMTSN